MPPVTGLQFYNDKMLTMAEHYDDFILQRTLKNPNIWQDRIPRGSYALFSGLDKKYNVYRGGMPVQAGLSGWSKVGVSRKPSQGDAGFDNCAMLTPRRYSYAWETITYDGYQDSFQSDPVCLEDMKWVDYAKEQLSMVIRSGVDFGISIYENFSREVYIWQAALAGRTVVFCDGALNFEDSEAVRFDYDPFLTTTDIDGATVPYVKFSKTLNLSALNWTLLDYLSISLGERAGEAALSRDSGRPIFGLMLDIFDFERYIMSDSELRQDFRDAKPQEVIKGYDFGMRIYRGMALMHDPRQMRFRFLKIGAGGNATDDETDMVIATRVLPLREGRAVTIGNVPEPNPAYYRAEIGIGVIFMNDVVANLFVPSIDNLGSGMTFGPAPGFTGEWQWINIKDNITNQLGSTGYFYGRFQIFPKPLMFSSECTAFLYKRCPQSWATVCGVQNLDSTYSGASAVPLAASAVAGDFVLASRLVTVTLTQKIDAGVNDAVTMTHGGGATPMVVADSSLAPTYTLSWASDAANAPMVHTNFVVTTSTVTIV